MAGYEEELERQALMAQMQGSGGGRIQRVRPQYPAYPEGPQPLTPMPDMTAENLTGTAAGGAVGIATSLIPVVGPFLGPLLGGLAGEGAREAMSEATGSREKAQKALAERGRDYGEERRRQVAEGALSAGISGIGSGTTGMIRSARIEEARKLADANEVERFDAMEQRILDRLPKPARERTPEEQAAAPGIFSQIAAVADTGRSAAAAPPMQAADVVAALGEELEAGMVDPERAAWATQIVQQLRGMA